MVHDPIHGFALRRLRLVGLEFKSPETWPEKPPANYEVREGETEYTIDEANNTSVVHLSIGIVGLDADRSELFSLTATIEGLFQGSQPGLPLTSFSEVNAPAILFPYLRELVTNMTARSGHPALILETVNFVELAKYLKSLKNSDAGPSPTSSHTKARKQ